MSHRDGADLQLARKRRTSVSHGVPVYSPSLRCSTNLYCFATEENVCEQLARGRTRQRSGQELNLPSPIAIKSNAPTTTPPSHTTDQVLTSFWLLLPLQHVVLTASAVISTAQTAAIQPSATVRPKGCRPASSTQTPPRPVSVSRRNVAFVVSEHVCAIYAQ